MTEALRTEATPPAQKERRRSEPVATPLVNVAVDTWALSARARHQGVHVYTWMLLNQFRTMAPDYGLQVRPYVCAGTDNDANKLEEGPGLRPLPTRLLKMNRLWRYGGGSVRSSFGDTDLVFNPHCTTLYAGVRAVTTIHDLIPVLQPWGSWFARNFLRSSLYAAAKWSRAVITVSEHSKRDILERYGIPEERVQVIYNGFDHESFNSDPPDPDASRELLARFGVRRSYILHCGAIKPTKNLKRLVQAFRLMLERNRSAEFDLVLAGPGGWDDRDVMEEIARTENPRGRVVMTGALKRNELPLLVKGAALTVIPSLYEGFCLPMLESMACAVPTIASSSSCLPEISGGMLRYFDPMSVEEMTAAMDAVLTSPDLQQRLSAAGLARAREFSWEQCARQTLAVLARAAGLQQGPPPSPVGGKH